MKTIKHLFLTLTLITVACSSDGDRSESTRGGTIELKLAGTISTQTRADYPTTQSTVLTAGETVYAWVDDAGDATTAASEYIKAWTLSCQADASLAGNRYYFPSTGNTVNVYAVHGNITAPTEGTTAWVDLQPVTHNVLADQATAGNYERSDFLYARNTSITRDNTVKVLNFKHQLAKIEIHLVAGSGMDAADITNATVKVLNIKPTATVTLNKTGDADAAVAVSGTPVSIQCRMQYRTDVQRNVSNDSETPDNRLAYAFAEAIVVPQWFSADGTSTGAAQQFLEVTLSSGVSLYTNIGPLQFEKGKKYGYNVVVNARELTLTSTITDWDDSPGVTNIDAY